MSGICVGTQLECKEGFWNLQKGVCYYFLRSRTHANTEEPTSNIDDSNKSDTGKVLLVEFLERPSQPKKYKSKSRPKRNVTPEPIAQLISMPRDVFEEGILSGAITKAEIQRGMPPWLDGLEGLNLSSIDGERSKIKDIKKRHGDRIDEKLLAMFELIKNCDAVLDSDDPEHLINSHARTVKKNETRLRCWFFTYLLFGRNRFSLHYPIHRIGKWSRKISVGYSTKRGRPSKRGKLSGYNTTEEMLKIIDKGGRREIRLGKTKNEIFLNVLCKDLGCCTREKTVNGKKILEIFHPDGKPFPEKGAFFYHLNKLLGKRDVKQTLVGKVAARTKFQPICGPFTEHVWNIMQKVESDGYSVNELARGLIEGSPLPPLVVVTKRDVATGKKTGIGFSQGGERSAAYRAATFCEAIGEVRYFSLFGVFISEESYRSKGVAPHDIHDRGPGATPGAASWDDENKPVVSEMTPSFSGQSKAVVESSNPKSVHHLEAPGYFQSNMRTFELVRREIQKMIAFNESCDVISRTPPDLADKIKRPGPDGLYELLNSLGRNDAVQISFEQAVRSYLDKVPAELTREGIFLHGQIYISAAFNATNACYSITNNRSRKVEIYFLECCLRHIWIDWDGELIELDLRFPVPVDDEIYYLSLEELIQLEAFFKEQKYADEKHRQAAILKMVKNTKSNTGKEWDSGSRVSGRPKRGTKIAKQEAQETKNATRGRPGK